jgi:methionine-rich copper-binding protein CopC
MMVLPRFAGGWLLLASLLAVQQVAWAEELRVMDTGPVNNGVERGRIDEFFVRFNQPVDHIKSEFIVKRGNDVIEVLQPRFKTEPDVLYAERSPLPPGDYTLVWTVRALDGQQIAVGQIAFKSESQR